MATITDHKFLPGPAGGGTAHLCAHKLPDGNECLRLDGAHVPASSLRERAERATPGVMEALAAPARHSPLETIARSLQAIEMMMAEKHEAERQPKMELRGANLAQAMAEGLRGFRNSDPGAGMYEKGFTRGYELGERDGKNQERARIERNRETGFSRGFEAGKALYKPVGGATKELIGAALGVEAHLLGREPRAAAYDRLIRAARAYRELMGKELR